jgi:hypothetical protein
MSHVFSLALNRGTISLGELRGPASGEEKTYSEGMWESSVETSYELYVSVSRENFPFCLAQRACAALRALSLRCSFVSFLAVAFPPRLPSCTAAGFFLTILIFYTTCASLRRPCRRYCVTVKTPELVAIPPGAVIAIFPVFAPVGTLAITFVSESTVTLVAGTPPNVTFVV